MTEREVVLRERAAFVKGAAWRFTEALVSAPERSFDPVSGKAIEAAAAKAFPLPTVTRPRVVRDENGYAWAIFEGQLSHASDPGGNFVTSECVCPTPNRIKIWADLLATPNETVDA